jgi:hypothetical protein
MADNKIPGNIIGVQIGSTWLACQADASLNIVANTSEDALCKVLDGGEGAGQAPWKTFTVDSREWNISVSAALLKDSLAAANYGQNLAKLIIDGDMEIANVLFRTATDQEFADYDMIYSGAAILTNFTVNAPATGANTTDATFQGNGALVYSYPPKTT